MGFHVVSGDACTAPEFWFNHSGNTEWSGKKDFDLNEEDIENLLDFARDFAYSHGFRNTFEKRDEEFWEPFHPNFLGGRPYKLWKEKYEEGLTAGCDERKKQRIDERKAEEARLAEEARQQRMQEWTRRIHRSLYSGFGCFTENDKKRYLGSSWLEKKLFPRIAKRALRKSPHAVQNLPEYRATWLSEILSPTRDLYKRLWWKSTVWRIYAFPPQSRYWFDQVMSLLRCRHRTHYQLEAFYYASTVCGKEPEHSDIYNKLSRLEAVALTWDRLRQGAFKVKVTGYLEIPSLPHAGQSWPMEVERLGWLWIAGMSDEPYLGWPHLSPNAKRETI